MTMLRQVSIRKQFCQVCIVFIGMFLLPFSSFALLHISNNNLTMECQFCHPPTHPAPDHIPCLDCHKNSSGGGYTDLDTIEIATHSSATIGSDKHGSWERVCLDCHQQHQHNSMNKTDGLTDDSYILADLTVTSPVNNAPFPDYTETTFSIEALTINDPRWKNLADWHQKTGNERGLLLVFKPLNRYIWWEVVATTDTTVTIANIRTYFRAHHGPFEAKLVYGMLLQDEVNGVSVNAGGPSTMAIDNDANPGDGFDESPDGICQVCHTQTTHWRSDGSFANHFSGWRCTLCHPHEQGFKPVPPLPCP